MSTTAPDASSIKIKAPDGSMGSDSTQPDAMVPNDVGAAGSAGTRAGTGSAGIHAGTGGTGDAGMHAGTGGTGMHGGTGGASSGSAAPPIVSGTSTCGDDGGADSDNVSVDFETSVNDSWQIPPGWKLDLTADGQRVAPHQGNRMAGVVDQTHADGMDLVTQLFDIPACCHRPLVRFWFWYDLGPHESWVYVREENKSVSTDTRNVIDGKALGWTQSVIDVRPWIGRKIALLFELQLESGDSAPAHWYIDDLSFECEQPLWNPETTVETFEAGFGSWSSPNGHWYIDSESRFRADGMGATSNKVAGLLDDLATSALQTPTLYSPSFDLADACSSCSIKVRASCNFVNSTNVYVALKSVDDLTTFGEDFWTASSGWQNRIISLDPVHAHTDVRLSFGYRKDMDAGTGSVIMIDDVSLQRP